MLVVHIFLLSMVGFSLQGCSSEDPAIERIKGGTFYDCDKATVDDLADNFFRSPSWVTIVATDGRSYVNLTGEMTYNEVPVDALVQFTAPMYDNASFEINAFEMNDLPQNPFMIDALVTAMCDEY